MNPTVISWNCIDVETNKLENPLEDLRQTEYIQTNVPSFPNLCEAVREKLVSQNMQCLGEKFHLTKSELAALLACPSPLLL